MAGLGGTTPPEAKTVILETRHDDSDEDVRTEDVLKELVNNFQLNMDPSNNVDEAATMLQAALNTDHVMEAATAAAVMGGGGGVGRDGFDQGGI